MKLPNDYSGFSGAAMSGVCSITTLIPGTVEKMNRRRFLQFTSALALWHQPSPSPQPVVIKKYDDGYMIQVGCLRCVTEEDRSGTTLVFGVFLVENPMPGVVEESRMLPTIRLQQELKAFGFPVITEIWSGFPVQTARIDHRPSPQDIAERLQQVLSNGDPKLLYYDWERLEQVSVDLRTILEP